MAVDTSKARPVVDWARLAQARTLILVLIGLGVLVAAAWTVAVWAGLTVLGASLLLLAYLTDPNGGSGGERQ